MRERAARALRWAWTAVALGVLPIACGGRAVESGSSAADGGASAAGAVAGSAGHNGGTGGRGGTGEGGGTGGTSTGGSSGSGGVAVGGSGGSAAAGGGIDAGSSPCECPDADYGLTLSDGTVLRYNQPSSDECGPTPLRARGTLGCGANLRFAACAGVNGELPCVTMLSSDRLEYIDASGMVFQGYPSIDIAERGGDLPIDVTVESNLSSHGRRPLFFSARLVACGSILLLPC